MIYRVILDGNDILNYQEKPFILINPSLSMELNTAGSFEFTMPPSHAFYDSVKPLASTIEVYEDETLLWFGRPVEVETDFFKQKQIYCEGALSFFSDSVQRPHEFDSISIHTFFRTVIANHNTQVGANRQFTVGVITIPDKTVYRKLNYEATFDVLKKQCLNTEGGYLFLRRENGTNYIDWYKEMPYSSNQPVEFGLNLLDMHSSFDGSSIATCVIPLGDTVEGTDVPLTVESVNNGSDLIRSEAVAEYGYITRAVSFSGVKNPDTLYEDGMEYLSSTQFDNLTIECTAAELHWQNENYGLYRLGQKIHCRSVPHLLDRTFDLQKISLRLDTAEKRITLGTMKKLALSEITKEISETSQEIDQKIDDAVKVELDDIDGRLNEIETTVEDITDAPDPDDFKRELEDLLDDLESLDDLPAELEGDLEDYRQRLEDAETYENISGIADDLQDTLDSYGGSGDYGDYSRRAGDISTGAGASSGSVNLSVIKAGINKLEKDLKELEKRVDSLRDYNELMVTWEKEVETRLAELEKGDNWIHQINGTTHETGTVNFVTEV